MISMCVERKECLNLLEAYIDSEKKGVEKMCPIPKIPKSLFSSKRMVWLT